VFIQGMPMPTLSLKTLLSRKWRVIKNSKEVVVVGQDINLLALLIALTL